MLWYVTFYCYHFSGTNREVSGLHFEGPSAPYNVHCGICLIGTSEYNGIRLYKWKKKHFISRLSGGFVYMSTSPSPDRRSDPSGETTINGVPTFLSYTLQTPPSQKCQVWKQNLHNFSNHRRNDSGHVCASILQSLNCWCFVQSFSNVRPHSSKNVSYTLFLF